MNGAIFRLTLQQIAGRRWILLLGLLAALVPIGLALIYRAGDFDDPLDWTANTLLDNLLITAVLPLACLFVGTSVLGSEIEDGTVVYLLAKPLSRRSIILAKSLAAALLSAAFVLPAAVFSPVVSLEGTDGEGVVAGFVLAATFGVFAYSALFVLLSVVTSRALLVGLAYVFIWEGAVGNLFAGTRYLSVRQYCLGIADAVASVDKSTFRAELGGAESVILIIAVSGGATLLAIRSLERLELRETD